MDGIMFGIIPCWPALDSPGLLRPTYDKVKPRKRTLQAPMSHALHHVSTNAAHDDVWYVVASHEESRECVRWQA